MTESAVCDACGNILIVESEDSIQLVHVVRGGDASDFCNDDCAFHFFDAEHKELYAECQVESLDDLRGSGEKAEEKVSEDLISENMTLFTNWCHARAS